MKKNTISFLLILLLAGLTFPSQGKIFWLRGIGSGKNLFRNMPNWQRIYQTEIKINGGRGTLTIWGCADALPVIMRKIRDNYTHNGQWLDVRQNEGMARGTLLVDGMVHRILALAVEPRGKSTVFDIFQSREEYEKSLSPPRARPSEEMPFFPGSSLQTSVEDTHSRTHLETSTSGATPVLIQSFFKSNMPRQGWRLMAQPGHTSATGDSLLIFQRKSELCLISTQSSYRPGENLITVLHKRLSVE